MTNAVQKYTYKTMNLQNYSDNKFPLRGQLRTALSHDARVSGFSSARSSHPYLPLPCEAPSLQVVVEGAQNLVGGSPQLGIVAAERCHRHAQGVAGHKLVAVDHRL